MVGKKIIETLLANPSHRANASHREIGPKSAHSNYPFRTPYDIVYILVLLLERFEPPCDVQEARRRWRILLPGEHSVCPIKQSQLSRQSSGSLRRRRRVVVAGLPQPCETRPSLRPKCRAHGDPFKVHLCENRSKRFFRLPFFVIFSKKTFSFSSIVGHYRS